MEGRETGTAGVLDLHGARYAGAYALDLVAIVAGYAALGEIVLALPAINPTATPLWPTTGLALALLLLRGLRVWPAILGGSFVCGAIATGSFAQSGGIAAATLLAGVCGAWLVDRWSNGRLTFETPLGVVRFALFCLVPTAAIGAGVALATFALVNGLDFADPMTFTVWWLTDAVTAFVVAPVVMLWAATRFLPFAKWAVLETFAIVLLAAAIGIVAYGPLAGSPLRGLQPYQGLLGFLIVLPLTWAGLRGNQRNAATATLIVCTIAAWRLGGGAAPGVGRNGSLLFLLAIATSTSLCALMFSAAIDMRQAAQTRLFYAQHQLKGQLAESSAALDNSKLHLQILMENVVDYAIFLLDTGGRVASWNGAAKHMIGYTADEIVGKHFAIFYRPDERRAGEPNRVLELARQKGKHEVEGWRIKKNGTLFFVTGSVSSVLDRTGKLVGFANVIRDATERRDAQQKLVQAREQLAMAQKMEAIGKLTGGIAHDFNNLLMIIGGNAQTFKRLLDPKLPRAIEAIQTAAKRGESLTRQLLTFARRQHLSPTVVDLNDCIANMRTMIESSLRGNIVYNAEGDPNAWPVKVDLAELELAIVNIAVNARDAMPNGGSFRIAVENVPGVPDGGGSGEFVSITFGDTGTGIPPDLLSKIFDPFFTTKEVGKGTGLGLSQVYGFAHQSGGMVRADSKVGQGTTVTLYLPALPEHEVVDADAAGAAAPDARVRPAVLIVDDSAEVAEVTSALFEHLGYDTFYRESAEAALKLLADGARIDLVFSDIVMPGAIDGVGLASEIRSHYPHLPVLLTTGYSDATHAVPADLRILRKPFDSEALKGFIQEAIGPPLDS
jgi:PAS domain S-box-containing protein